jgi:putative hydrolase of the HAD superfamily
VNVKAVFFDAGDTLLAPHPSFAEIFAEVVSERGQKVDPHAVEGMFQRVAPTFVELLDGTGSKTWSTSRAVSKRFWGTVYQVAFGELGIDDSKGELAEALYDRFTRYESYRLFPDSLPALRAAKEAGLMVGLISNFEEWLEGMLAHMEVAELLDVTVISGKEGIEKPDPAIFRLALDRAGVEAASAVYVGDQPKIDIEAAAAIGMRGVLIDRRGRHPTFQGPRITALDQLLLIL